MAVALQNRACKNCGAQLAMDTQAITLKCAFCDSEFVIEVPESPEEQKVREEASIILFKTDQNQARDIFSKWIKKGLFKPRDLVHSFKQHECTGIYIPCFQVRADAQTTWHGRDRITIRQATENQPAVYDYRERSGHNNQSYTDYITASKGLEQREADWILPFDDNEAKPYNPDMLRGFQAERPSKTEDNAVAETVARVKKWEDRACSNKATQILSTNTSVSNIVSKLFMLPVWIMVYIYKAKPYRVIINGQTGKIRGGKPVSKVKVIVTIVLVLAAAAAAYLFGTGKL